MNLLTPGTGISRLATRLARRHLVGALHTWTFTPPRADWKPPRVTRTSIYLHVPFCRNDCPYCPYTTVPYRPELVAPFTEAALAEVDWWADAVGPAEVTSVYVGGGTPTVAPGGITRILDRIRHRFRVTGRVAVETNPADVDEAVVEQLKESGVSMVSLGAESFHARQLAAIGRRYKPETAERALALLACSGFATVNADIMFALPEQTTSELVADLERAAQLGADEITTYPLFTFPYSAVGRYLRLKGVRLPDLDARRRQYHAITAWARRKGFERVSVWSFRRGDSPRYSSVTRDGYLGIGPGSGSQLPDGFTLDTFDLDAWGQALRAGRSAISLRMPFAGEMAGWWWLYWRLYDTSIPLEDLDALLGDDAVKARRLLGAATAARLAERHGETLDLTDAGAFWLHLVQNHFALAYVDRLWTAGRRDAWPPEVRL